MGCQAVFVSCQSARRRDRHLGSSPNWHSRGFEDALRLHRPLERTACRLWSALPCVGYASSLPALVAGDYCVGPAGSSVAAMSKCWRGAVVATREATELNSLAVANYY